jgi:hypothetical protein
MKSRKLFSAGFMSVLVVLAAVSAGGLTGMGADSGTVVQDNNVDREPNDNRQNASSIEPTTRAKSGVINHSDEKGVINHSDENKDVDFYKFNVSSGQAINVYLLGGISRTVEFALIDPNDEVIANNSNIVDAITMGAVADETGTYYLRVSDSDGLSGNYYFSVELADQDSFEPNDNLDGATAINTGEQVDGTIATGDTDFFAIEADAGDTINASAALRDTNVLNQGNIAIDILNADGNRLNEVDDNTSYPYQGDNVTNQDGAEGSGEVSRETVNTTVEEAGTYYIRIKESPEDNEFTDIGGFVKYDLGVFMSGADQPTTEKPTTQEPTTEEPTETTTETETGSEQPTASVTFDNQSSDGTTVTVESITMSKGGFVAIHNTSGPVIGVSEYLSAGTHENIEITLFDVLGQDFAEGMALEENQTLIAMPHLDTNGNEKYEFVSSGGSEDGPYTADGSAVVDTAFVTAADGADEDDATDDADVKNDTAYYQVDFVVGEPIENLRGPNGTYTNDQLVRFLHGSSEEPITRRSEGEFVTDEAMADRIESQDIEVANGTATTTFTVAEGESITLTLASYEKVGPGWSPQTESEQVFVDSETRTFESGTHTLTVELPDEDLTGDPDDANAE